MSGWLRKRRVMRRYNQSAGIYDALYREEQEAKIRTAMDKLTLEKEDVVLDAGCGTGLLFEHVAGRAGSTIGTDVSKGLLKEAKKKTKAFKNSALILADADNLPFLSGTFDTAFALTLLQNMPSPRVTLNEINRVSKPNAPIAVTGLRKVFSQDAFAKLLNQAGLRIAFLKTDEKMRDYVSVCFKELR
jgi:ubiquinone/menaquinone biosynthesis C-methylase UbiE